MRNQIKRGYPATRHRSPRYWLVYQAVVDHIRQHRVGPTYRQLRNACGISSNSIVAYWLDRLEEDGLIIRWPGPHGLDLPGDPATDGPFNR